MKNLFENLYQIFLIATNELFLFNFFHILKKKKKRKKIAAEYPKLLRVPHTFYCLSNVYVT